jgi:hypothetical protein
VNPTQPPHAQNVKIFAKKKRVRIPEDQMELGASFSDTSLKRFLHKSQWRSPPK